MEALLQAHRPSWNKLEINVSLVMLLVAQDVVQCKGVCCCLLSLFPWEVFPWSSATAPCASSPLVAHWHRLCDWTTFLQRNYSHHVLVKFSSLWQEQTSPVPGPSAAPSSFTAFPIQLRDKFLFPAIEGALCLGAD